MNSKNPKMFFYLILGSLFTVYSIDLLALVIASWVARGEERKTTLKRVQLMYPFANSNESCSCIKQKSSAATRKEELPAQLPTSTPVSDGLVEEPNASKPVPIIINMALEDAAKTSSEGFSDSNSDGTKDDEMTGPQKTGLPFPFPRLQQEDAGPWLPQDPSLYPKVLIQLPQYNEEHYGPEILRKCCKISWPRERLLIQVLDDSTKHEVREAVDNAAISAVEAGYPIQVIRRDNRGGFKAGALVEGLHQTKDDGFEYAAIFDADFSPPTDFLLETIPHLHGNPRLGFVQTRWNSPSHSFLTWCQRINLDFHFDIEQRARSFLGAFFNFNGTAGVWRIACIHDSGGWESDTVVEDMDLSLRSYLRGWRGTYLANVTSENELPPDLATYKTQQFRWLSGPMQILVKMMVLILTAKNVSFVSKLNCYWFFLRYLVFSAITIGVLSVPPVILWISPWEWLWPQIFFLISVNLATLVYLTVTPWSVPYLLFSVSIGYFKTHAMLSGLVGSSQSKKWKVTKKGGSNEGSKFVLHPPYLLEIILFLYYTFLCVMCFLQANYLLGAYCGGMSLLFLSLAFGDNWL